MLGALLAGNVLQTALFEGYFWCARLGDRRALYTRAKAHARALDLPLVVVGAPDGGVTRSPGDDADLVIDLYPSRTPAPFLQADIADRAHPLPIRSGSCVVFVSCVLEYVNDYDAALEELVRISDGRLYVARVQPWTLTAYLYPGTKRRIPKLGPLGEVNLRTPRGIFPLALEIVDTPAARERGYRGHAPPRTGEGMLFILDQAGDPVFSNAGVPFALDLAALSEDGQILAARTMQAGAGQLVRLGVPSRLFLETPAGWLRAVGAAR